MTTISHKKVSFSKRSFAFFFFSPPPLSHGVDMISCYSWYCICSVAEYFVSSVVSILYCKFLIDDLKKTSLNKKQLFFRPEPVSYQRVYCFENQGWHFLNLWFFYAGHFCIPFSSDTEHTILICIDKFSHPRKATINPGRCFLLQLHAKLLFSS